MTKEQIDLALVFWTQSYQHRRFDKLVIPYLELEIVRGWVKGVRNARYFTAEEMAEKLKISKSAYQQMEMRERKGTISINNLKKVAHALDCELIYALRPIDQQRFSASIWEKLVLISLDTVWVKSRPEYLKSRALAAVAKRMMESPEIRKSITRPWKKKA